MPLDPKERARRALVRSLDVLTELVTITADPGDDNPDPKAFVCIPDDILDKTFKRVGLDDEQEMQALKAGLMIQLPEIKPWIKEKLKLKPDAEIGLVWQVIVLRLSEQ